MKVLRFLFLSSIIVLVVSGFSTQVHADLELLGVDNAGNRLIYDTELDITWYDYYTGVYDTWQNQVAWASGLSVTTAFATYDGWRLPTTVDGSNLVILPQIKIM